MSYFRDEPQNAAAKIWRLCPDVYVDTSCDYGFRLEVRLGDNIWTLFQPAREENGQPEITTTPEKINELIAEWRKGP